MYYVSVNDFLPINDAGLLAPRLIWVTSAEIKEKLTDRSFNMCFLTVLLLLQTAGGQQHDAGLRGCKGRQHTHLP
jgi:hypothetical protein